MHAVYDFPGPCETLAREPFNRVLPERARGVVWKGGCLMEEAAIRAAGAWCLDVKRIRDDVAISGSPQRSDFRCVVECPDRGLVVLENIRGQDRGKKQAIIDTIDFLCGQGLSLVHPYMRTAEGRHIVQDEGFLWQASPYVQGVPLDRPGYAFDQWRGTAMADFLIDLRRASGSLHELLSSPPFSILNHIDVLMGQIRIRVPGLVDRLAPVAAFLQKRLAHVHDNLPRAFCHGDYHPLNIIWSENAIQGVIDWEFSGIKPEIYDAATLIGCLGMEIPDALTGPGVMEFVRKLKAEQVFSETSWRVLVEMTIAIRFGWLSEWLRNHDEEMIELEMVYMHLLMDHADDLVGLWYC
jgi:homoserine kinase type II